MSAKRLALKVGRLRRGPSKDFGVLRAELLVDQPAISPFSVLRIQIAPGKSHPCIFHERTAEFFLVMRGAMGARINGRLRRFAKDSYACLPPGATHAFEAGREGVEVLVLFSPAMDFKRPDIVPCRARGH